MKKVLWLMMMPILAMSINSCSKDNETEKEPEPVYGTIEGSIIYYDGDDKQAVLRLFTMDKSDVIVNAISKQNEAAKNSDMNTMSHYTSVIHGTDRIEAFNVEKAGNFKQEKIPTGTYLLVPEKYIYYNRPERLTGNEYLKYFHKNFQSMIVTINANQTTSLNIWFYDYKSN